MQRPNSVLTAIAVDAQPITIGGQILTPVGMDVLDHCSPMLKASGIP